jgi:hypothetical protein
VNKARLAYYFEATVTPGTEYIEPAVEAFREWRTLWNKRRPILTCEQGPGFVVIHDTRPKTPGGPSEPYRIVLGGIAAKIYSYCQTHRSRAAIGRLVRTDPGGGEGEVQAVLDDCVGNGLMFRENDRYLSLAVATTRPQRRAAPVVQSQEAPARPESELLRVL